jgi:hypothetical protein
MDGWRHLGDADVHVGDDYTLRHASENGHLAVVECLIKHGAAEVLAPSWRCQYPRR